MINIFINGCTGKMGQEIVKLINSYDDLKLIGGLSKQNSQMFSFPVYTRIEEIESIPDVIIDFSILIATFNILNFAKENKIPIVIATTRVFSEKN